jgi:putative endonuclease
MGELDVVARDGETIVFVEVKTRSTGRFGTPFESVTWKKRRRLCSMAAEYVLARRLGGAPCRFDVVAVTDSGGPAPRVEIVQRAFDLNW